MIESQLVPQSDDQKYTNYVDPSTIMINHYKNHISFESFGKCIQKIEQWLSTQQSKNDNKPLVISTEPSSGQIPMLVKWMSTNQERKNPKKQKNLIVIHFASMGGNNTNYFYAIYRFLNKLRESLKIKQKVELLQQKIRKYFAYWLDVCGSELEKQQITNQTTNIYDKIILVIEGIQNFKDPQTGKESNIAFWLPRCFPSNIKVIVTADANSDALNHFSRIGSEIINIESNTEYENYISQRTSQLQTSLDVTFYQQLKTVFFKLIAKPGIKKNMILFTEAFISTLSVQYEGNDASTINFLKKTITQKLNLKKLVTVQSLQQFYVFIINFWIDEFNFKLKDLLLGLILNQKGLTYEQLNLLCSIESSSWRYFKHIFRFSLIQYKQLFMIQQPIFKSTVIKIFSVKQDCVRQIHEKIADVLQQTPNSIRKLEQETYHLYVSKCYFKLKEKISNIENFLLLFNPANKYDFSRYWQKLQEKGFDPVIEYNKAIEGFSMHYHPTEQSIFRIIVQISRFLKEFCDFETYFTPNFRHPPIEGSVIEMDKIGLLKELEKLEIFIDNSCNKDEKILSHPSLTEQIKEVKAKYFPVEGAEKKEEPQKVVEVERSTAKSYKEQEKKPSFLVTPILSYIEQLNVDVPKNRETFKTYYMNLLKDYMEKKQNKESKDEGKFYLDENQIDDQQDSKLGKKENKPQFKLIKLKQNFTTIEIKPSLYYYKRWIWIQFPWACISLHNNYSQTPQLCLTSATEYMSVESQAEFTRQALKIAIEAKQRKKLMFAQKLQPHEQSKRLFSSTRSQMRSQSMDIKLKTVTGNSVFSAIKNINLNLQSLTKELQQKRSKYLDKTEHIRRQESYESVAFMTEAKQRQVDFIEKRKVFTINNSNPAVKSQLLPKIKSDIKDHTLYELNYLKSHIEEKKKSINQIIYENNKLEKIYKELKIKEWQSIELTNIETKKSKNFEQLERKKETTITQFCKSLLQKERLKIILKLCSENKTKNQQYLTSLNYLLQNLKKMINWQKGDMKKLQTGLLQIQTLNELTKQASKQKEQNEQILNSQIRMALEAKSKIESQITQMSMVINEQVYLTKSKFQDNLSGNRLKNEQKNKQMQLQRNAKMVQDELQVMQKNYNDVAKILNITDFNFRDSEKYQQLMKEKYRNKELNLILFERSNKLQELKAETDKKKKNITTQSTHQISSINEKDIKNENKQIKLLNETCLKYKIGFENLGLRLKLKNKSRENILQEINVKLNKFKDQNEEEYLQMIATNRENQGVY